jgi:hypothetical protein
MKFVAGTAFPYEWLYYGALVLASIVIADALLKSRRRVFVSKRYADGEVTLEVRNGSEEIAGVRVMDTLPADAELGALDGGKLVDLGHAKTIRWSVPALAPGERCVFKYGLRTREKILPGVEVSGTIAKQVKARSADLRL